MCALVGQKEQVLHLSGLTQMTRRYRVVIIPFTLLHPVLRIKIEELIKNTIAVLHIYSQYR